MWESISSPQSNDCLPFQMLNQSTFKLHIHMLPKKYVLKTPVVSLNGGGKENMTRNPSLVSTCIKILHYFLIFATV